MKLLKYENMKLKQQFIFNLPVSKLICGRSCPGCYALKAQIRFPKTVLPSRERLYDASVSDTFVPNMIAELQATRRTARTVRLHESGEFHSQAYINKWQTIATALPDFTFYAFTKRLTDFDFTELKALPNVVIINSQQFGAINYGTEAQLKLLSTTAKVCPATGCGTDCTYCQTKEAQEKGVLFIKH